MTGPGPKMALRFLPIAILAVAALLLPVGCDRPEPPPDERPAGSLGFPPGGTVPPQGAPAELAKPLPVREEPAVEPHPAPPAPLPVREERAPEAGEGVPPRAPAARDTAAVENGVQETPPAASPDTAPPTPAPAVGPPVRESPAGKANAGTAAAPPPARKEPAARKAAGKPPSGRASAAAQKAPPPEIPMWARGGEELSYKITFMGVTAGYARLISKGRVRIGDHEAYHILIKAWTTGTLSALFPISESFDYYLDAQTLAPIRRDSWLKKVNRPEVVLFDQEKGVVTHWYGDTMEMRKKKEVKPPTFYDGVSATYFFRARGFGDRNASIRLFGGRKVYRVSSERAGEETIPYGKGTVDTILVKPIYREEGGSGEKPMVGELVVWVSKDPRRVPVKLYASFTKGLEWKLVGQLTSGLPGS